MPLKQPSGRVGRPADADGSADLRSSSSLQFPRPAHLSDSEICEVRLMLYSARFLNSFTSLSLFISRLS
jgi:hypothetical protein